MDKTSNTHQKKQKPRCHKCNTKLKVVGTWTCECSYKFCTKCRIPEIHNCTFDYSKKQKAILKAQLIEVKHEKIIKI